MILENPGVVEQADIHDIHRTKTNVEDETHQGCATHRRIVKDDGDNRKVETHRGVLFGDPVDMTMEPSEIVVGANDEIINNLNHTENMVNDEMVDDD